MDARLHYQRGDLVVVDGDGSPMAVIAVEADRLLLSPQRIRDESVWVRADQVCRAGLNWTEGNSR